MSNLWLGNFSNKSRVNIFSYAFFFGLRLEDPDVEEVKYFVEKRVQLTYFILQKWVKWFACFF